MITLLNGCLWFAFGLILAEYVQLISDRGSFLDSIWGRSKCDSCKKEIPWYALIPIAGRLFTKSRCISCGKKVSSKYFWFEVLFSGGWLAVIVFWGFLFLNSYALSLLVLVLYCATWLLMYEDLKRYSVPISWLIAWCLLYLAAWYYILPPRLFWGDTLLMLGVLGISLAVVALRKPAGERSFSNLFGAADLIVLVLFSLLLGYQATTAILVFTMVNAILFLVLEKRLKTGQKLPMLTVMLPWGFLALLLL